ncbi:hypothetical protein NQ315_009365 [Exocentrus adspersus]|uniref:ACB domain-containing protein n=1 Tax=Exocentrus adspersus TaxID=1586481 RepID=A0AAV8WIE6_9CUCU|nr:hypothetical protein NQ315_009365 [Exocentrus adspersus]
MTTEEKFNAAVNVIRSLPKNGSYQPSNDLMLRFYGYFKQATLGPCCGSRPAFWDVVARAKYDAWKKLGDMSKEEAMAKYLQTFLEAPTNELDTINIDDLELIAGDVMERVRSLPNSPLASREASPIRIGSSPGSSPSPSPSTPDDESDHSDDEYIDTIENPEPRKYIPGHISVNETIPNGYVPSAPAQHISRSRTKSQSNVDISQEISKAVQHLKADIEKLTAKVNSLDNNRNVALQRKNWYVGGLSPRLFVFFLVWPFIAGLIMNRFMIRRN